MLIIGSRDCAYYYGQYRDKNYQVNHRSLFKRSSYQEATILRVYRRTKADIVAIDHSLTKNPFSAHHSIELLLNLKD